MGTDPAHPAAMRIGFIGIGAMGLPMALRLRDCGHPVAVHDIDSTAMQRASTAGCTTAASPAAVAGQVELLIVAVVDAAQTHAVLFDQPDAAAPGLRSGTVVLLCPTIGPDDVEAVAARLALQGAATLDAPMSGGPARARDGSMSLMVAGADAAFARVEPVLRDLSSRLFRIGTRVGDGARTKLVNNLLAAVNLAAAAEALALATQLGLDPAATLSVIEQSSGQSWIGSERGTRWIGADPRVLARVALLAKDSKLALACAHRAALAMPLGEAAGAAFGAAVAAGRGDADDSTMLDATPAPDPELSRQW